MEGTIGSDSGAMIRDGMKSVNKLGVCPEDNYGLRHRESGAGRDQLARADEAPGSAATSASSRTLPQLKGCLAAGYPFVFGFTVYESFESAGVAGPGRPDAGAHEKIGGHAVMAVGYDDSTSASSSATPGGPAGATRVTSHALRVPDQAAGLASGFWISIPSSRMRRGRRRGGGGRRPGRGRRRGSAPRPSAEVAAEFDRGPTQAIASICLRCPPPGKPQAFWTAWGPIFYRGRLDGSARILASRRSPGPTERVTGRTLVGDAGQRVQGFLTKLGLTRARTSASTRSPTRSSHPAWSPADEVLADPEHLKAWRNGLYDAAASGNPLQEIVAFGANAQYAVDLWTTRPAGVHVSRIPHPSSRDTGALLTAWHAAIHRPRGQG